MKWSEGNGNLQILHSPVNSDVVINFLPNDRNKTLPTGLFMSTLLASYKQFMSFLSGLLG